MVVGEASIHNIMGGMESTGGVRLHNHKRKLKQRFDIIKKLGQGTYGKVQLGINKETGQEVAIKTIKKCKIETEADLIRIRREIQIMSSVQHPNIIHIYEVFENKEKMVLVMEYAAGGELYDYLSERKVLSEQEARRIFRQISIAVFYCHKHKICHRDLKLENILLDQIGNAKIADFGLSNVFDEQRLLNTFCGSPLYASPEIVKGTPYHGPEVDCWSLGVLLYTLVYGAMPFDGSNFKRLTRQISQSDYFEPKTPSPASPLIKDMLTKCPARRSDIEKICSHWWVNEGHEQNCLEIAEDLAAQTPVRLDLLLSLVPQSASADKLVVGDQRSAGEVANDITPEAVGPTRCHSVGSLMELDCNDSDRRVREMVEEEPRGTMTGESKRKLENTPSMEEQAGLEAGAKRKERLRKKDKNDETRPHRFTSNRHHSAPIAHPITEESMEIDPTTHDNISTKPLLDLRNDETASACLELIKESLSKSPSKERSKTPVAMTDQTLKITPENICNVNENVNDVKPMIDKLAGVNENITESADRRKISEDTMIKQKRDNDEILTNRDNEIEEKIVNVPSSRITSTEDIREVEKDKTSDIGKVPATDENQSLECASTNDIKKFKQRALSLDSNEISNEAAVSIGKTSERRRSKIFETAEKFNQLAAAGVESEKPKKIFIPGVNVGGAKRAFERKASLSSIVVPQSVKQSSSKVIIDVPNERKNEKIEEKSNTIKTSQNVRDDGIKREEEKKRAVDIITGAIGKPPVQKKINGSPPITPHSPDSKKLGLKIQLGPNDVRSATVSVSTPIDTKFPFEKKPIPYEISVPNSPESQSLESSYTDEPTMSSKMEITLKSATLPRQRKTSKAEITLSGIKSPESGAFKSELEAKIDAFHPQKLRTQRSEVAFPVAAVVPHANRSSSLEPEGGNKIIPKERIIPIQVEMDHQQQQQQQQRQTSTPPPKPPMPQRSMSQRSGSLSRQSTADSDTDSALGSTIGPEPIRKSPREYIIPIAVEGGGYVTPRSGSVEPDMSSKNSTPTSTNPPRSRFGRPRRMSSLLSDASEDESPFSTLHRDSDDLLQRHMHRLRSSRPTRQPPEHADSLSSGEDDDDDGFELLTAENLFSTLLSRVRSLTQRLNVDDNRGSGFPSSRLLGRLGSNSSQGFWGLHEPLSRRLSESQFRRSMSRDTDRFGKRDSAVPSNSGTPSSPGTRSTPSRESIFEMGSSNTLPRDKKTREDTLTDDETDKLRKIPITLIDNNFTPCLARRLSRQFIEKTRQSLPRSPSIPREKFYRTSSCNEQNNDRENHSRNSTISDQTEYRSRSCDRGVRRTNSLLDNNKGRTNDRFELRSRRRSVSLFDDDDDDDDDNNNNNNNNNENNEENNDVTVKNENERLFAKVGNSMPRQIMTLGRKYRDTQKCGLTNFHNYRTEKIQEEPHDDILYSQKLQNHDKPSETLNFDDQSISNNSTINYVDTGSSLSAISCETSSPTESSSTIGDFTLSSQKHDKSRDFENRLMATEAMIKESKARNNLGGQKYERNLTTSYENNDKCEKELFSCTNDVGSGGNFSKRRSCIPSLRLRSGSLTREAASSMSSERRNTLSCSKENDQSSTTPDRSTSLLGKFFRSSSTSRSDRDTRDKSPKPKVQRRISRFLRPDFFDTPREESQYVKDKEAQKAADNERRKSRFTRKKSEPVVSMIEQPKDKNDEQLLNVEKPEKELKNEANAMTRDKTEILPKQNGKSTCDTILPIVDNTKIERQPSRNSFLQTLEKKLEKFRSSDDGAKLSNGNCSTINQEDRKLRENSAPPCNTSEETLIMTKRPESNEDLRQDAPIVASTSKSRVSTVLGLFKNDSAKLAGNGQRPQSTILSKFKRNTYKGSRSDGVLSIDQIPSTSSNSSSSTSSSSKIPTKFSKIDPKTKKIVDSKKSPEKTIEMKQSPLKEKTPPDTSSTRKTMDKQQKTLKKSSPEKLIEGKSDKPEKSTFTKDDTSTKNGSTENTDNNKISMTKLSTRKLSLENRSIDNKQMEAKINDNEDKKIIVKAKKNVRSLTSLVKNGSVSKIDTRDKTEEPEKRIKKVVKSKDVTDKDSTDNGTKKKKIIRVTKKIGKNSDSSESKSEEKESSKETTVKKTLIKKITSGTKKDTSSENSTKKIKEKSPENVVKRIKEKSPENVVKGIKEKSPEIKRMKEKSPEIKIMKEKSPEIKIMKEKSPEIKIMKEKSPEIKIIKEKSPEIKIIKEKSPEIKIIEEKSPEIKIIKEKSPEIKIIKEKSPEIKIIKEKSPEFLVKKNEEKMPESPSKIIDKSPENLTKFKDNSSEIKISSNVTKTADLSSSINVINDCLTTNSQEKSCNSSKIESHQIPEISGQSMILTSTKDPESPQNSTRNTDSETNHFPTGLGTAKSNKTNLKLDLTKIPQHSFKIAAITKKDSTKMESSDVKSVTTVAKIPSDSPKTLELDSKLLENLSKISNSENTRENKINIDESLRSEISKNHPENLCSSIEVKNIEESKKPKEDHKNEMEKESNLSTRPTSLPLESKSPSSPRLTREITNDQNEQEIFSPLDDTESFDSWSICSADMNNHRHDLNSPTSPTYSPMSRGDHSESIIDRIRRKSFYSRFNERKRKTSLNVPPPGVSLSSCSTLPRKFSFNNTSRDKETQDYRKPIMYGGGTSRRNPERSHSLYNEKTLPNYGKSSIDRERHYSDSIGNMASFSSEAKTPNDQYGSVERSCYDPLRRYRVSPSPESTSSSLTSHRKYPSTDYGLDSDMGSYRNRLSPSFHNDSNHEVYTSRSMLPRKYGSTSSFPETKTADYYEELLTPSRSDYLTTRNKTPIPNDYHASRHENGYHNGNLDHHHHHHHQTETDKRKIYSEKIAGLDLTDVNDGRLDKQTRSNAEKDNESQELPASSTESDAKTSKAE